MADSKNQAVKIPQKLIKPIKHFLEEELKRLRKRKKAIASRDPFNDPTRDIDNSLEEDVDEQLGHFEAEVKVGFIQKQIVQLRKVLTRIKLGKYGVCESCGKMIDTDRLAARPETTLCIKCEKERES